jgi:hypothetical protein
MTVLELEEREELGEIIACADVLDIVLKKVEEKVPSIMV